LYHQAEVKRFKKRAYMEWLKALHALLGDEDKNLQTGVEVLAEISQELALELHECWINTTSILNMLYSLNFFSKKLRRIHENQRKRLL
jgi:hypothetical protein